MTHFTRRQRTIARTVRVQGFGYWSGKDVSLEFRPAPPHAGIVFIRQDRSPPCRIAAIVQNRIEALRRTTLVGQEGDRVEMVEHVLAALSGLQIDNCEIVVDAAEMPGLDGSSLPIVRALVTAGVCPQQAERPVLVVREAIRVGNEEAWVQAQPHSAPGMLVGYQLDYGSNNPIGRQHYQILMSPEGFMRNLAPARTFIFKHEAEWLRHQGLAMRATHRDLLVYDETGPIDNPLRFPDECVRHKTLDMIGDLSLAGCDLQGSFWAYRSGHRLNAELVRVLSENGGWGIGQRRPGHAYRRSA